MSPRESGMQGQDIFTLALWCVVIASPVIALAGDHWSTGKEGTFLHHHISISVQPDAHALKVRDAVTLPGGVLTDDRAVRFLLHGHLHVAVETPGATLRPEDTNLRPPSVSANGHYTPEDARVPVTRYRLTLPIDGRVVTLRYEGKINHPPLPAGDEYGRTSEDAAGVISPNGIFLSGASYWYPTFEDVLQTFTLDIDGPDGFQFVSQGERQQQSMRDGQASVTWHADTPQDEIYLIGAKWLEYERREGPLSTLAFLRTPDPALAEKYLALTGPYVRMYERLVGPYPYRKFALVENFWETGYGMPSFTLLGPTVLRLPFIPTTSYPHEILHNWWGNSVYVDYREGNWCEGLTAYLADHLMAEQRAEGALYRRTALKRYTDYVQSAQDFPIRLFRERHDPATKAIGYGKTLMFFHMLRRQLGDERFVEALRTFYRENRFQRVPFSTLAETMSRIAESDLQPLFVQWIHQVGAPELRASKVTVERQGEGYRVRGRLEQVQSGPPYQILVPLVLHVEGREQAQARQVFMGTHTLDFALDVPRRPVRLEIDPEFDLFRRLHRAEIPPSLSEAFGDKRMLFVLPADESPQILEGYQRLAASWKANLPDAAIRLDRDLRALPQDRGVWLLGWRNRFRTDLDVALKTLPVVFTESEFSLASMRIDRNTGSAVVITRQPNERLTPLAFLATDVAAAIPGLSRKVPHYDRYSYLAFTGEEPKNVLKGEWPILSSPLSIDLVPGEAGREGTRAPRRPLVSLEP